MADEVMQSHVGEEPQLVLERPPSVTEEWWEWAKSNGFVVICQYGRYWVTKRDPKEMAAYEQPTL